MKIFNDNGGTTIVHFSIHIAFRHIRHQNKGARFFRDLPCEFLWKTQERRIQFNIARYINQVFKKYEKDNEPLPD